MDNTLSKTIAKLVFYGVATVLIIWTASLTYAFVAGALPAMAWYVPLLSLVVFDLGMIAWLYVYRHHAQGSGQRATAICLTILDLIGVGLMVIAEILLGGQQLATAPEMLGEYAIWGIGIWTVVNVSAVVGYHLLAPGARVDAALQDARDRVFEIAIEQVKSQAQQEGGQLAQAISGRIMSDLRSEINGAGQPVAHQLVATAAEHAREEPTIFPVNGARPTRPASKS